MTEQNKYQKRDTNTSEYSWENYGHPPVSPFSDTGAPSLDDEPDKSTGFRVSMLRPILYRCTSRCVTALTAALFWKKFWSDGRPFSDAFTVAAICLFAMAWFSYLRLDGLTFRHFLEERKKKRPPRASLDLTDFADEHILRDEEMLPHERTLCSLIASLISGGIFVFATVVTRF